MIASRRLSARKKSTTSVREDIEKIYNLSDYRRSCHLIDAPPIRRRDSAYSDGDESEDGDGFFNCECFRKLKRKKWFNPVFKTLAFLIHFAIVFSALGTGAYFLANIEDPAPSDTDADVLQSSVNGTNETLSKQQMFWKHLQNELGIDVDENKKSKLMDLMTQRVLEKQQELVDEERQEQRKDRSFIFWKWVYFTSVACTTIGEIFYFFI